MTQIALKTISADIAARRRPQTKPVVLGGKWLICELAAEGSFSRIYRARHKDSPPDMLAPYAVKVLRPGKESDPRAVRQLIREAVVGRSVSHPNLISILGAGLSTAPRYLVMPWLDGATLRSRIPAEGTFETPVALWIARQVAEGLDALYRAGWMHGDVKPSNIFLSPTGHATLLDLGLSRRRDETSTPDDHALSGTSSHLAPELITSKLRADIRSDIYSLGVVLFEMFSGRLPFTGRSLAEVATQHKMSSPPDLRRLAPYLPAEVASLVHHMLAKEPLRRPQTPGELIDRLIALEVATFSERSI